MQSLLLFRLAKLQSAPLPGEDLDDGTGRARAWLTSRLSEENRWAVKLWRTLRSQVRVLHPNTEKAAYVLDLQAAEIAMRWHRLPAALRAPVWQALLVMLDVEYHEGRNYIWMCFHGPAQVDPNCFKCQRRWKCPGCDRPFVIHLGRCEVRS